MDTRITTVFLSMALTISFTRIVGIKVDAPTETWIVFGFFCFNKVRYFMGDIKFNDLSKHVFKDDALSEQVFYLFLGITTFFLFIVVGYYVIDTKMFFLLNSLALLFNTCSLILLSHLIDPARDKNERLTLRVLIRHWCFLNAVELAISLFTGLILFSKISILGNNFDTLRPWLVNISLGLLLFSLFMDLIIHKNFIFDPNYTTNASAA